MDENEKAKRIFLACFIIGVACTVVVLQINMAWFVALAVFLVSMFAWFVSALLENIIVDIKKIIITFISKPSPLNKKKNREEAGWVLIRILHFGFLILNGLIPTFVLNYFHCIQRSGIEKISIWVIFCFIFTFLSLIPILILGSKRYERIIKKWSPAKTSLLVISPIGVFFITPIWGLLAVMRALLIKLKLIFQHLLQDVLTVISQVPKTIVIISRAVRDIFIFIYSDILLLHLFYGGVGVITCFGIWRPHLIALFLGALAGGLLGVANFYFISVKLLRLVSLKAKNF